MVFNPDLEQPNGWKEETKDFDHLKSFALGCG